VDEQAADQLSSLRRVGRLLDDAGIAYWLYGGWAVDFYAGEATRPHDDVDLAVWFDDLPRIDELLRSDGWRHAPDPDEDGGTGYERDGVRFELLYLVYAADGRIVTPLRDGPAVWSADAFADDARELNGVRSTVMGLETLTGMKRYARGDPEDMAKDRADLEHLARLSR